MIPSQPPQIVFAFLTVRPTPDGGFRGGYLLTTQHGRPIEFHYTSDMRLRGPQRLLFGERIDEFVEVDLIAVPLVERQSVTPTVVVVDRTTLLELRTRIPAPVACLGPSDSQGSKWSLRVHSTQPDDEPEFLNIVALAPPNFDWLEPFDRLAAALAEIRETRIAA
jgi:hypothetical protein